MTKNRYNFPDASYGHSCVWPIAKIKVRCWTHIGVSKSVGVCMKIFACNEIILNDCVKSEYIYWNLLREQKEANLLTNVK